MLNQVLASEIESAMALQNKEIARQLVAFTPVPPLGPFEASDWPLPEEITPSESSDLEAQSLAYPSSFSEAEVKVALQSLSKVKGPARPALLHALLHTPAAVLHVRSTMMILIRLHCLHSLVPD